jgi:hypothetical protein
MSRRNAFWVAVAVGLAVIAALSAAGRLRQRSATTAEPLAPWAPDPGPRTVAAPAPRQESPVQTKPSVELRTEPDEQPLPTWVRLTIVGVALLAFLAVSLIATKSV